MSRMRSHLLPGMCDGARRTGPLYSLPAFVRDETRPGPALVVGNRGGSLVPCELSATVGHLLLRGQCPPGDTHTIPQEFFLLRDRFSRMGLRRAFKQKKEAVAILDDAVHLLRFTPAATWLSYLLGTLPFVLGLLFYCADMSTSSTASRHLIRSSLGLTVLYLWMKCWQAVFCSRLQSFLVAAPVPTWEIRPIIRLVCIQLATMPWKFIIMPIAILVTLPFGWCYAFFENMACAGSGHENLKSAVHHAWNQALMWPRQNHLMLLILSLHALLVFANLCVAAYFLPILMKSLVGVETVLSHSNLFLMDSTFWLSMAALTYLCVNPLVHAAYVIRCRDGAALTTGEDLLSELKQLARPASRKLTVLLIVSHMLLTVPAAAIASQEIPSDSLGIVSCQRSSIPPDQLDSAIAKVMERIEFTWKLPNDKSGEANETEDGFMMRAWNVLFEWIRSGWNWVVDVVRWLLDKLDQWIPGERKQSAQTGRSGMNMKLWLGLTLALVLGTTAALARRYIKTLQSRKRHTDDASQPIPPPPDLNNDEILPDELPESRWLSLAGDCLARGELRLAVRALHLGTMSRLAETGFLSIARSKSNWEYMTELKRRAHTLPNLIHAFSKNTLILERAWYGHHAIDAEVLDLFLTNHKQIMADVQGK
jgi:hypothetical protein